MEWNGPGEIYFRNYNCHATSFGGSCPWQIIGPFRINQLPLIPRLVTDEYNKQSTISLSALLAGFNFDYLPFSLVHLKRFFNSQYFNSTVKETDKIRGMLFLQQIRNLNSTTSSCPPLTPTQFNLVRGLAGPVSLLFLVDRGRRK